MSYIRIKKIKNNFYAHLIDSIWVPGKGARQRVIKYMGKVDVGLLDRDKINVIWASSDGRCFNCGKPGNVIDHIIPLSKGGNNDLDNLQVSCHFCNYSKGNKIVVGGF